MEIQSNKINLEHDENGILIISFSNQHEYLMIQDSLNYDEQDVELGMDTYYLEVNDQSKGGYGGIDQIELEREKLKIGLNKIGIDRIGVDKINIHFTCNQQQFDKLTKELTVIKKKV